VEDVSDRAMIESGSVEIRPASEGDISSIARVLVYTWRSTFKDLLPADFLDTLSYAQQEDRHRRIMAQPGTVCFVAARIADGAVIGFANGGPNRTRETKHSAELYAIYVSRDDQGCGIGKRLFGAALQALRGLGHPSLVVWVLEINPYQSFYARVVASWCKPSQ
jgi:GNAT superfamily N-acetyltransferase